MTGNDILKADLLDIVFDNRNKSYGAYSIRKFYGDRLLKSLGYMMVFTTLLLLLLFPKQKVEVLKKFVVREVSTTPPPVERIPEKPIQKPLASQQTPVAQKKFLDQIKIETDNTVMEPPPDVKSLEGVAISDKTMAGTPSENAITPPLNTGGTATGDKKTEDENHFQAQESSPQFPGGEAAWMRFLAKYLVAPADLEAGERKTVMVRFFVGTDGAISQFEVLQSGGAAFDKEVIRVLQKMPRWKPAVQNGHPVSVTFTQPVTFVGMEE